MAEKTFAKDENGIEIRSDAAKWLSPTPDDQDMTRVMVGPTAYVYVDPASLFALQRLMEAMRLRGKFVKTEGKGFKKFVRDIAELAWDFWPPGGYVNRVGLDVAVPVVESLDNVLPFPPSDSPEPDLIDEPDETEEEPDDDIYPIVEEIPIPDLEPVAQPVPVVAPPQPPPIPEGTPENEAWGQAASPVAAGIEQPLPHDPFGS